MGASDCTYPTFPLLTPMAGEARRQRCVFVVCLGVLVCLAHTARAAPAERHLLQESSSSGGGGGGSGEDAVPPGAWGGIAVLVWLVLVASAVLLRAACCKGKDSRACPEWLATCNCADCCTSCREDCGNCADFVESELCVREVCVHGV